MNGTSHSGSGMENHSPTHPHSPIDQLEPTNLPHPAMGLPICSMPLGMGIGSVAAVPINVSTGGVWQDPISAGGMGSTTPQGMPPGGAFWDDMMWDAFTPMPDTSAHHQGFAMEGYVDSSGANWSPHTSDVSSHHGWSNFPGHGHPM